MEKCQLECTCIENQIPRKESQTFVHVINCKIGFTWKMYVGKPNCLRNMLCSTNHGYIQYICMS